MSKDFVVSATGERAAEWREVFGTDRLPVESPIPEWASAPGHERAQFYKLDLAELTDAQRERVIAHVAAKFGQDLAEVRNRLPFHGMPLLAEGLSLTVYHPQRWIPDDYDEDLDDVPFD